MTQAIPQERISEQIGGKVPRVIPPRRISERNQKQIVDVPGPKSTPQKRISERIQEQMNGVPGVHYFPQWLQSIPQEQFSERIEKHIVGSQDTSSSAAVPSHCHPAPGEVEYIKYRGNMWGCRWDQDRQLLAWRLVDPRDGFLIDPDIWVPP